MKKMFLMTVAAAALVAGSVGAQDLKFAPGEDAKFSWSTFEDFKKAHGDLKGQTLKIFGPWRGDDQVLVESMLAYFENATGVDVSYSSSENTNSRSLSTPRPVARRISRSCRSRVFLPTSPPRASSFRLARNRLTG